MSIISPSSSELHPHPLETQVGGHPGVLSSEDGALVIKPCLPNELAIYEKFAASDPHLIFLQPFVPKFFGTLKLQGKVKEGAGITEAEGVTMLEQAVSIVIENVSSYFEKPNILDIKLGTVLYDDSASAEKKQRMTEAAAATTSLETGVRLTGFEVYDHTTRSFVVIPKSYGKTIKPADLPDGIRRFFPLAPNSEYPEGLGLPQSILLPVLTGLLDDLRSIREAFAKSEVRMVGASLLVVYEADWDKAKEGLERQKQETLKAQAEDDTGADQDIDEEEDSDGEEEGPPYVIKLIDFAHTKLVPGEGPDSGVLKGIDTTISLFEGRIKEVASSNL